MKNYRNIFTGIVLLLAFMFISGCVSSSKTYGKLRPDNDVRVEFETYKVNPDYNYYYYGPKTFPQTIIGLSKDVELVSDLWRPIELNGDILKDWVWVRARREAYGYGFHGKNILSNSGEKIGVWYSLEGWQQWSTIEMMGNNQVRIGGPIGGDDGINRRRFGKS